MLHIDCVNNYSKHDIFNIIFQKLKMRSGSIDQSRGKRKSKSVRKVSRTLSNKADDKEKPVQTHQPTGKQTYNL